MQTLKRVKRDLTFIFIFVILRLIYSEARFDGAGQSATMGRRLRRKYTYLCKGSARRESAMPKTQFLSFVLPSRSLFYVKIVQGERSQMLCAISEMPIGQKPGRSITASPW